MVEAICKELSLQNDYLNKEDVNTIYFGGGTPSLLSPQQLEKILSCIDANYIINENPEITLEANPDDLDLGILKDLKSLGINRLSIGIQSFSDDVLKFLNRAHNANEAKNCIDNARKVGFKDLSLDLIYAIPDRDHNLWKKDLELAIDVRPTHISSYCLTIEPDTVFGRWHEKGKLDLVNDDYAADQFDILVETLQGNGYEQYEVSNFCLPGHESKHNSSYWKQEKYLGVGPSAHSYDRENRQFNVSHNKKYLDAISAGRIPFTLDSLSQEDKINDYLLTTLRTKWGANLNRLQSDFDYDLAKQQSGYVDQLIKENKAFIKGNHLILTKEGLLLADKIASDLFLV